ncbi:hypothetical protein L596_009783 [Steinernema carpocapsae]|uniref:Uncharacterized protein n=1 Tax=Steinernema carpocapsae TaxID=34508 RepID=A0A4U5PGV1_STECR|nr:hypothetical protein L596_009783 [Steinernema carpocapsae]
MFCCLIILILFLIHFSIVRLTIFTQQPVISAPPPYETVIELSEPEVGQLVFESRHDASENILPTNEALPHYVMSFDKLDVYC